MKLFSNKLGFTLIELLIAVVVIAVGMVFVLGALSQCLAVLTTASKTVEAGYLLNQKMWEQDRLYNESGSSIGVDSGVFDEPYEGYSWVVNITDVSVDFGDMISIIQENLYQEKVKILWQQGKIAKDISASRFIVKKK